MPTLVNTLYPPQINTFLPAFVNTSDAIIYFSLSPYNSSSAIQRVHVSLVNQLNNENALINASGILISSLNYDTASGMYYVVIPVTSVEGNQFNINQFYKVQVRFDCYEGEVPVDEKQLNSYFLDYQNYFSEWSSVCLIRPILQPDIQLRTFDTYTGSNTIAFNKGIIPISGKMFFGEGSTVETETLQSYQIQILNHNKTEIMMSSPTIYTGDNIDPNDLNYRIDLQGLDTSSSIEFVLRIVATTKNQYKLTKDWEFQISDFLDEETFDPTLEVSVNDEEGIATLHISNVQTIFGTIYVKRASSLDNFKTWEDIYVKYVAGPIDLTIEDNTVSSLVWYRYSIQMKNSAGALTNVYRSSVFMPKFYDAILSRGDKQLKILYNYTISNFKPVVNRAKIDTLGGRYPKFAENAILNYKQFSITGIISSEADPHQLFLNKQDYFDDNYSRYTVYKQDMGIKDLVRNDVSDYLKNTSVYDDSITTTKDDWLWEREFREEVIKWLNDGEPKLYRSMTEGSMAVMLTDINLTPNTDLSRRLYSFSATVYEIAESNSLETLDSLGIYNVVKPTEEYNGSGSIDPEPEYVEVMNVGQLYQYTITDKNNLLNVILQNLKSEYGGVLSDKDPSDLYLKNVKIFFHNQPNVYLQDGQNILYVENPGDEVWSDVQRDRMQLGYVFNVGTSASQGNSLFFVNKKGYYQIPSYLDITSLSFDRIGDIVTIEYVMVYKEKNNVSTIISGSSVDRTVIGQERGVFEAGEYLGERIRAKYNFVKTGEYYQRMQYWRGICVDVDPFSILHLQYYKEDEYHDYIVGDTGVLHLQRNFDVQDMCFLGKRMHERPIERQPYLEEWEYVLDKSVTEGVEGQGDTAYWNDDGVNEVIIQYDAENKEYSTDWEQILTNGQTTADLGYASTNEIKEPKLNTVYLVNGELKIYYQYKWYKFQKKTEGTGWASVPVEGIVNYYGNVVQSDYN